MTCTLYTIGQYNCLLLHGHVYELTIRHEALCCSPFESVNSALAQSSSSLNFPGIIERQERTASMKGFSILFCANGTRVDRGGCRASCAQMKGKTKGCWGLTDILPLDSQTRVYAGPCRQREREVISAVKLLKRK